MTGRVALVPAGETVTTPQPGDFFLVHGNGPIQRLIQLGQRLRFTKEEAHWNHTGLFTGEGDTIIEALAGGVTSSSMTKYQHEDYFVVHPKMADLDRSEAVAFATYALGDEYGFVTDLNLALWCLFGGRLNFSLEHEMICSALVARSLERGNFIFDRDPSHIMPADLARKFNVHA